MSRTYSCILVGLEVVEIEIETVVGAGFSGLHILGLRSDIARDMRERIRSALESIGILIPARRVIVNLSNYELFRLARSPLQELDFAVAASIILALFEDQNIPLPKCEKEQFAGMLTLSGFLKPVQNTLIYEKYIYQASAQNRLSITRCGNSLQCNNFETYESLLGWINERKHGFQDQTVKTLSVQKVNTHKIVSEHEIEQTSHTIKILLQNPKLCVAILIAAAGPHHLLIAGEPGIGKTYAIKHIKHFLKPMNVMESLDTKLIHAKNFTHNSRPFRAPHHTASAASLIGGQNLKPGEATLAHHGVLFLDEIAEFSRNALESLREPLDSGRIELSRSLGSISYPAQFLLCATTNSCPCGYFLSETKPCRCLPHESKKYLSKISGPLIDRFELKLWVENIQNDIEKKYDIFSEYLLNLTPNDLYIFSSQYLELQKSVVESEVSSSFETQACSLEQRLNFEIEDNSSSDMSQLVNLKFDSFNQKISLRGTMQINRLYQTFRRVFPTLIDKNNFTDDIFMYRNFMQILENDLRH